MAINHYSQQSCLKNQLEYNFINEFSTGIFSEIVPLQWFLKKIEQLKSMNFALVIFLIASEKKTNNISLLGD
jgi:hypothetical protein